MTGRTQKHTIVLALTMTSDRNCSLLLRGPPPAPPAADAWPSGVSAALLPSACHHSRSASAAALSGLTETCGTMHTLHVDIFACKLQSRLLAGRHRMEQQHVMCMDVRSQEAAIELQETVTSKAHQQNWNTVLAGGVLVRILWCCYAAGATHLAASDCAE